jgi:hypothetical protein
VDHESEWFIFRTPPPDGATYEHCEELAALRGKHYMVVLGNHVVREATHEERSENMARDILDYGWLDTLEEIHAASEPKGFDVEEAE